MTLHGHWRYCCVGRLARWATVLLFVLTGHAGAGSASGAQLTLKPAAMVDQAQVRLDHIATLAGASPEVRDSLGAVIVANAPPPGKTRFVGVDYVRVRLKQAGYDTDSLTFDGAPDVRIQRRAAKLPAERIRRAVETAIRRQMPWKEADVALGAIQFDETIQIPAGELSYRIVPSANEDFVGRTQLSLHLFVNGQPVRKLPVQVTLTVMTDAVTVIRPLGRHQPITRADLAVERRDRSDLPSDALTRIADALGNRAARKIYPHTVLQSSMIAYPPLVRRGEIVKIIARSGPMTITATGQVKQQGAKGDLVKVVNTDSNRMLTARVTGPGAVAVDF